MRLHSRITVAAGCALLVLVIQTVAIEAVFFPPELPFRLDNGVPIIWNPDDDVFLSTGSYRGTRLGASRAKQAIAAVHASMRRYPQWILGQHLEKVVLVDTLTHKTGGMIGGLASGGTIFLTARSAIHGAFHHELAHVLHQTYGERLSEQHWHSVNPPGFQYGAPAAGSSRPRGDLAAAFVSAYAMTNVREDFAETAEALFGKGYENTFNGAREEALKRKAGMLMEFYRSIDPVFTKEYFKNLS